MQFVSKQWEDCFCSVSCMELSFLVEMKGCDVALR